MILTCPKCLTQYLLNARALGADGRRVRCSQCQQIWHQVPLEAELEVADVPTTAIETLEEPAKLPTVQRKIYAPLGVKAAAILCIFVALGAATVAFRGAILKTMPGVASLYEIMGYYDTSGLNLEGMELAITHQSDNKKTIALSGRIFNQTSEPKLLPKVLIKLVNEKGDVLSTLDYTQKLIEKGNSTRIEPQAQILMDPRINNIPDVVKRVVVDIGNPVELMVR